VGQPRLLEGDWASQCSLDGEAITGGDVVENPLLKLDVNAGADFCWNFVKGAKVQFGCAIVGVEPIYAKTGERKTAALAAAGRPATTIIRGRGKLSAEVGACVFAHVFRELVLQKLALLVDDPQAECLFILRFVDLVTLGEDLIHERVEFLIVVHIDGVDRQWFRRLHTASIIWQVGRSSPPLGGAAG
jgi:hypothetical protein